MDHFYGIRGLLQLFRAQNYIHVHVYIIANGRRGRRLFATHIQTILLYVVQIGTPLSTDGLEKLLKFLYGHNNRR